MILRPCLLLAAALATGAALPAAAQPSAAPEAVVQAFFASGSYRVDSTAHTLPLRLQVLVNRRAVKAFRNGLILFNRRPFARSTRHMLCYFRQRGRYVILYNHGAVGQHMHLLYVDRRRKQALFFYFNAAANNWRQAAERLKTATTAGKTPDWQLLTLCKYEA